MFKDRLMRGAFAGAIAGLCLMLWNLLSFYILHFAKVTWLESLTQIIMGHKAKSPMDFVIAVGLLMIWNGFLGALFVRWVVPEKDGSYIGRAVSLGLISWFLLYSLGTMYQIPTLHHAVWQTALSNWIAVTIFGIVLGWLMEKWDVLES